MFYIKFNVSKDQGNVEELVRRAFAENVEERDRILVQLMNDPAVGEITFQEFSPVGKVYSPYSFTVDFECVDD